jgi:hypothetical protein
VSLPAADDLFRPTEDDETDGSATGAATGGAGKPSRSRAAVRAVPDQPQDDEQGDEQAEVPKKPSGRVKHDEKMTVYVTAGELLEIEHARLALRSRHGLAIDRGRLVREAIHLVLADLEQNGEASAVVRRLHDPE